MTKDEFLVLLMEATEIAIAFGKQYVVDTIHSEVRYSVYLNSSFDELVNPSFTYYPTDANKIIENVKKEEVIELLCRKSEIPVWIDISLYKIQDDASIIKLICSSRYSSNRKDYYYIKSGLGPFAVKSPDLPFTWKEGQIFSIRAS